MDHRRVLQGAQDRLRLRVATTRQPRHPHQRARPLRTHRMADLASALADAHQPGRSRQRRPDPRADPGPATFPAGEDARRERDRTRRPLRRGWTRRAPQEQRIPRMADPHTRHARARRARSRVDCRRRERRGNKRESVINDETTTFTYTFWTVRLMHRALLLLWKTPLAASRWDASLGVSERG